MARYFKGFALLPICVMMVSLLSANPIHGADFTNGAVIPNTSPDIMGTEMVHAPRNSLHNRVHMLVVFTKFLGDDPDMIEPPAWSETIFNGQPGSINHYFDTITFDQIKVTGEVLPVVVELPKKASSYGTGEYGLEYTYDTLTAMDLVYNVSFTQYDNDGPDGIPGSADDDGYVDYFVLMPLSQPSDFLNESVIGLAYFPITNYTSNDIDSRSRNTRVDGNSGCIANGSFVEGSIGLLAHEFIHSFDILDLYDTKNTDSEDESGGIGFWGIMGTATLGWNWQGGPVNMCAYTRMKLGAIGINNNNLKDIYGTHTDIRISDVTGPDGCVYRIWLNEKEYFLIEHRRNDGSYYDRDIPANGLLIWHVYQKSYQSNNDEMLKLCDLECADGRYIDAGYPLGLIPSPDYGRDNLDFYAKSDSYRTSHAGNLGDATDVFDGVTYTSFDAYTNPNTNTKVDKRRTNISITNIRKDGDDILFDVMTEHANIFFNTWLPHIGLGFNGLNNQDLKSSILNLIGQDLYIVNRIESGLYGSASKLISIGPNGIDKIDLQGLSEGEVQSLIESCTLGMRENVSGAILERVNVSTDEFENILALHGGTDVMFEGDDSAVTIQKITATVNGTTHPAEIHVLQNYPNPFNARTTITYNISTPQSLIIEVYNILGQCVSSYDQGYCNAGTHTATITADGLASGVYLYRISGETVSQTKRFIYLR